MARSSNRRTRRIIGKRWQYIGIAVLAILALGVVALNFISKSPESTAMPNGTVSSPSASPMVTTVTKKTVSWIGDSYSSGSGAQPSSSGFAFLVAANQSWTLNNFALGGTGYTVSREGDVAKQGCGLDICQNYLDTIDSAVKKNPQIIVVAGGRNDAGVDPEMEAAGISAFYEKLHAAAPKAKIIALNPWWDASEIPDSVSTMAASIKDAVTKVGGSYVDAGQPLQGHPELVGPDGVHPTNAGHTAIAEAVGKVLGPVL